MEKMTISEKMELFSNKISKQELKIKMLEEELKLERKNNL